MTKKEPIPCDTTCIEYLTVYDTSDSMRSITLYQYHEKPILLVMIQVLVLFVLSTSIKASSHSPFPTTNHFAVTNTADPDSSAPEGTVKVNIIPRKKNSIFNGKQIHYRIHLQNTYNEAQDGTVGIEIKTDRNLKQMIGLYKIHIRRKGSLNIRTKFMIASPGFYDYVTQVNLSSYDDTIRTVFGYKPTQISTPVHKPVDFEKFWLDTKKELASVKPNYIIVYNDTFSSSSHKFYRVEMQSLDNITIRGWLSIPRLGGKFPVILVLPGYKQVLQPFFPDEQAIFCLTVRSIQQMEEKGKNQNEEPEYCMVNIDDKNNFIYRGAYMDCIRAVDFIFSNYKLGLDTNRIIVFGGSQGGSFALITAAMDHRVAICGADNPLYCDMHNYYEIANCRTPDAFPIKYYNQYLRKTNTTKASLLKTLDYFDVQNFMPYIKCPSLVALGTLDPISPPSCVYAAYNKMSAPTKKKSEIHILTNVGHEITERYSFLKFLWIEENTVNTQSH